MKQCQKSPFCMWKYALLSLYHGRFWLTSWQGNWGLVFCLFLKNAPICVHFPQPLVLQNCIGTNTGRNPTSSSWQEVNVKFSLSLSFFFPVRIHTSSSTVSLHTFIFGNGNNAVWLAEPVSPEIRCWLLTVGARRWGENEVIMVSRCSPWPLLVLKRDKSRKVTNDSFWIHLGHVQCARWHSANWKRQKTASERCG